MGDAQIIKIPLSWLSTHLGWFCVSGVITSTTLSSSDSNSYNLQNTQNMATLEDIRYIILAQDSNTSMCYLIVATATAIQLKVLACVREKTKF